MAKTQIQTNIRPTELGFNETASLYVGDLHRDVTEDDLFSPFGKFGGISSLRVVRHILTHKSLGYAYINYKNYSDADDAMKSLNYNLLKDKSMRIMWNMRDPTLRKSGAGNIFIKNLGKSINQKALYETFLEFGNILSCKIVTDEKGVSKGFGFVHFENPKHADIAISRINGSHLNVDGGKCVYVAKYKPRNERQNEKYNNLYIKNFDATWDDTTINTLFSQYGKIISAKIMMNNDTTSRCFGFVSFENPDDAMNACKEMNDKDVEIGETITKLYVARAQKKSDRQRELAILNKRTQHREKKNSNLYVKHLDDSINDEFLKKAFEKFGPIASSKIMLDENGRSRGFGFVCFEEENDAKEALSKMMNHILISKPLYVSVAQTKEERRMYFQNRQQFRQFPMQPQFPGMGYPGMAPMISNGMQNRPQNHLPQFQYRNNMMPGMVLQKNMMGGTIIQGNQQMRNMGGIMGPGYQMYGTNTPNNNYGNRQMMQHQLYNNQMNPAVMNGGDSDSGAADLKFFLNSFMSTDSDEGRIDLISKSLEKRLHMYGHENVRNVDMSSIVQKTNEVKNMQYWEDLLCNDEHLLKWVFTCFFFVFLIVMTISGDLRPLKFKNDEDYFKYVDAIKTYYNIISRPRYG